MAASTGQAMPGPGQTAAGFEAMLSDDKMTALLQSQADELHLLPALPAAWPNGHFAGLRARSGVELDLAWGEGRATEARLRTAVTGTLRLRAPRGQQVGTIRASGGDVPLQRPTAEVVQFEAVSGGDYHVSFSAEEQAADIT